MKNILIIVGLVLFLIFGYAILNSQKQDNQNLIHSTGIITTTPPPQTEITIKPTQGGVPLPQETDIIHTFFNLIDEKRISNAVGMMTESIIKDDSQKQAWGVQFAAIKSVEIVEIAPSMQEEWKIDEHTYRVTLNMSMDPSSATAAIPYFGYDNGKNIRWITIKKEGSMWRVMGLATGP